MLDEYTITDLEKLLLKIRHIGGLLLGMDAMDRWGPQSGPEREALDRDTAVYGSEMTQVKEELKKLVILIRNQNPDLIKKWCDAHKQLLNDFISRTKKEADINSTEIFTAQEELKQWEKVRSGKLLFTEQNFFYIHYDADLYRQIFGLETE